MFPAGRGAVRGRLSACRGCPGEGSARGCVPAAGSPHELGARGKGRRPGQRDGELGSPHLPVPPPPPVQTAPREEGPSRSVCHSLQLCPRHKQPHRFTEKGEHHRALPWHTCEITTAVGAVQAHAVQTAARSRSALPAGDTPGTARRPGQARAERASPAKFQMGSDPEMGSFPPLCRPPSRPLPTSRLPGWPEEGLVCSHRVRGRKLQPAQFQSVLTPPRVGGWETVDLARRGPSGRQAEPRAEL